MAFIFRGSMSSKTQICNVALTLLKAPRINNINDGTEQAKDLNALYDIVAEYVMAIGPWPSTIRRAALAQLSETPAFGFDYYYQLPTDPKCLRVLEVDEAKPGLIRYQLEGNKIATDEDTFSIRYISYLTDPEEYDPYLKQSIIEHLKVYIMYGQTSNEGLFMQSLQLATANAQRLISHASAQTGSKDLNLGDDYLTIRE